MRVLWNAPGRARLLLAPYDELAHQWSDWANPRRGHGHQRTVSSAGGPLRGLGASPGDRLDDHAQRRQWGERRLVLGRVFRRDGVRQRPAAVSISVGRLRPVLPAVPWG